MLLPHNILVFLLIPGINGFANLSKWRPIIRGGGIAKFSAWGNRGSDGGRTPPPPPARKFNGQNPFGDENGANKAARYSCVAVPALALKSLIDRDGEETVDLALANDVVYKTRGGYRPASRRYYGGGSGQSRPNLLTITNILLVLNVVGYGLQQLYPSMTMAGAKITSRILRKGELYRLVTPMFLHGSNLHLLMNCMALVNIGPFVEKQFGSGRMLIIYLLSGVGGNLLSCYGSPAAGVGASGAVFGLIGAAGSFFALNRKVLGKGSDAGLQSVFRTVMINAMMGMSNAQIDNFAHGGGFISGLVLAALWGPRFSWRFNTFTQQRQLVDDPVLSGPTRALKKLLPGSRKAYRK